jgi:thiamine pyrophosphate-dependent acetolactate synthase large subunit-like protein
MVMTDGYFGSIRPSALTAGLSQNAVRLAPRQFADIARVMGFETCQVSDESSLQAALRDWETHQGPMLCQVALENAAYMALTGALR